MPRIPTTAEQRSQNIGGIDITTNVSTPFQQFSVPVLDDGLVKGIGDTIQSGVGKVEPAIASSQAKNEKRALLRFQIGANELNNELLLDPETGLGSKAGGEALSLIRGTVQPSGKPGGVDSLNEVYAARLETLRAAEGAGLSSDAQTALNLAARGHTNSFSATVNKAEIQAQEKVDLDLVTERISSAVEMAAGSVGQDGKVMAMAIGTALNNVEAAVRDADIGLASQKGITDPKLIDELVRKQQGLVYKRVIEQMIATGNLPGAMSLLRDQQEPGRTLRGTAESVALNTQILTARQTMRGQRLYGLVRALYPNDVNAQIKAIQTHSSIDQALMLKQFNTQNALNNIIKRDQIGKEMLALVTFMQANPGKVVDPRSYPALSQFAPRVVFEAGGRVRGVAAGQMMDAATALHVAAGGSAVGNSIVTENMMRLAETNPAAFVSLMDKPKNIKLFTNPSQWLQLQSKEITARQAQIDAVTKPMSYDSVLKDLGFKAGTTKYDSLIQNPDLHTALTEARQRVYSQTGNAATMEDLTPIIAKFALPVDKTFATNPTLYHLSEYSKKGTVDSKTMLDTPLDLDKDRDLVPLHYALDRIVTSQQLREIVDEMDSPVTLRKIAKEIKGGLDALKLGQWEQDRVDFNNAVLAMGYPPDFISDILDTQGKDRMGLAHTEYNAQKVVDKLISQPDVYERLFSKWASGAKL